MGITLFVVISAAALCATAVVISSRVVTQPPLGTDQDTGAGLESAETMAGETARREWQVTSVKSLSEAEDLLDCLEAQGFTEREMIIQGNEAFAVRWR